MSIRSAEGYQIQKQVKVEGEVLFPGIYTILNKDERISDVIKRAGGLTALSFADGASLKRPGPEVGMGKDSVDRFGNTIKSSSNSEFAKNAKEKHRLEMQKLANLKRLQATDNNLTDTTQLENEAKILGSDLVGIDLVNIIKNPRTKHDLLLEDGDIINVPKLLQTVKVTGEVLRPINVVYSNNRSMKQYINGAGGFTYNANKKGTYIQYANGSVDATRKFLFFNNYPKVKPGAEIFVPKRAARSPLGAAGVVGIFSGLATVAAVLISVLR